MKDTVEFEGKTIDEAIEKACAEFGVPRDKLQVEILSEGSQGLFGLGSRKARISAGLLNFDIEELAGEPDGDSTNAADTGRPGGERIKADKPKKETVKTPAAAAAPVKGPSDGTLEREAKNILEGILTRMGLDFPIRVETDDEYIVMTIEGDGTGLLIGKGGQTLDAIQYVVNKAVGKNGKELKRIILDTENYREKKKQNLIALAEKVGEKVRRTKKPIALNPMNAHDRRIVHMALQNEKGIVTKSRGEGAFRKIIVIPSKKKQG